MRCVSLRVCRQLFLHGSDGDGGPRGHDKNDIEPAMEVVEVHVFTAQNVSDVLPVLAAGAGGFDATHNFVVLKRRREDTGAKVATLDGSYEGLATSTLKGQKSGWEN